MGKKTQTKAGKASAPAKVPVKNSINLFIEEKHTGKNVAEIAIFAVFMVGVALFSKFCVQGKLVTTRSQRLPAHHVLAKTSSASVRRCPPS